MTVGYAFFRSQRRPRLLLTVLAAFAIGPAPTPAIAGPEPSLHDYPLAGLEIRATSVLGTFVGGAGDSSPGGMLWKAVVRHTPLTRTAASPALIIGGGVQLQLWSQEGLSQTSRIFSGGTITYAADRSSGSACGQQVFHVSATLATTNASDDSGLLEAYLTHHRRSVFGHCITYAATVRGSLKIVN